MDDRLTVSIRTGFLVAVFSVYPGPRFGFCCCHFRSPSTASICKQFMPVIHFQEHEDLFTARARRTHDRVPRCSFHSLGFDGLFVNRSLYSWKAGRLYIPRPAVSLKRETRQRSILLNRKYLPLVQLCVLPLFRITFLPGSVRRWCCSWRVHSLFGASRCTWRFHRSFIRLLTNEPPRQCVIQRW